LHCHEIPPRTDSGLTEIARILRPGGLFAAYDCDWPPTLHWELDRISQELAPRIVELVRKGGQAHSLKIWPKEQHLDHMRESNHFRFTCEVLLHHIEQGSFARFF